ncbi:MAG: hypothetical protein RIS36_2312 [Pseudomonadota bacterium]
MRNEGAQEPAARGRIIRKGGVVAAATVAPSKIAHPAPLSTTAESSAPGRIRGMRDTLLTCIGIPFVFAASAGFMWSRPLQSPAHDGGGAVERGAADRFHHIGREMAGRFSAPVTGVVVKPELKMAPVHDINSSKSVIPQKVAFVPERRKDESAESSQVDNEALKRQVFRILKKHGRPVQNGKELAAAIVREALAQNYDPVFVAAVIKSESAFNSLARSHKGAQGLMQIMPKTGAWLADRQSIPRGKLTDPGHNLKLGISYLKHLEGEYGGNRVLTLVAYNWGPGHVASASAGDRRVPGEVMQYAVKILNDYRRWSSELRSSVG